MKNVLIPTDLTIKSLKLIATAAAHFNGEELNITLTHPLQPDNSISALLSHGRRVTENRLCTEEFKSACEVIRNKYGSTIGKLKVEFYYGATKAYMRSYLEARQIDAIMLNKDELDGCVAAPYKDLKKMLSRSGYPVIYGQSGGNRERVALKEESLMELLQE